MERNNRKKSGSTIDKSKQQTIESFFGKPGKVSHKQEESKEEPMEIELQEEQKHQHQLPVLSQNPSTSSEDYEQILKEMGYSFEGREMKLYRIKDKTAYQFNGDQQEYDYLNYVIINYVQQVMKQQFKMNEVWIPENQKGPKCNIFLSENFYDPAVTKCFIIIQGTGAVRAGLWSRKVCTTRGLILGSMIPQIEWAQKNKMSCIVFNPNMSRGGDNDELIGISRTMEQHCHYVWENYVNSSPAKHFAILAHSAGGRCVASLFEQYSQQFVKKVKALVFTDAFYHSMFYNMNDQEKAWAKKVGMHYKIYQKEKPLGEPFKTQRGPITEVSAGTNLHEMSTGMSQKLFYKFFETKLKNLQ